MTFASGLTRSWVRLYTRGVSPDARTRRRAEVDCDLWEQADGGRESSQRTFETALEILARALLGMPADLSWRLEHRSSRRPAARMIEGSRTMLAAVKKNKMLVLSGILGAFYVAAAFGGLVANLNDGGDDAGLFFPLFVGLAALLILGGLVAWRRSRHLGGILLACGAALGGLAMWWSIFVPVLALLIVIWVIVGWKGRTPAPA